MLNSESAAYIAGLFDGEGSITYKKYKEKKRTGTYDCWRIVMEITMRLKGDRCVHAVQPSGPTV